MSVAQNIQDLLSELHNELTKLYGERLVKLVLYGSQARGDAVADSDVDVMVVLKEPVNPLAEILRLAGISTELSLKYQELISILPISDVDFAHKQTPLLRFVRREGLTA